MAVTTADFWLDPSCPWSVMTAACLAEVPQERGIDVRWHAMSLAVLSEVDEIPEVAWVTDFDEAMRLSHRRAMPLGGDDVGSPILAMPGPDGEQVGFYGPIISRPLDRAAAARPWDACLTMATTPGFFELKRTRDEELQLT